MATRSIPTMRFNRIVQLQRRTVSRDAYGSEDRILVARLPRSGPSVDQTGTSEDFKNDAHRNLGPPLMRRSRSVGVQT